MKMFINNRKVGKVPKTAQRRQTNNMTATGNILKWCKIQQFGEYVHSLNLLYLTTGP
jgi:hypothetical protein